MKRKIAVLVLIMLFLLPVLYSPQNLEASDSVLPSLVETNIEEEFSLSVDGAESSDSIPDFSETLVDDETYYPDGYKGSIKRSDYRGDMTAPTWFFSDGVSSLSENNSMIEVIGIAAGGSGDGEWFQMTDPDYSSVSDEYHIVFDFRTNVTTNMNFLVYIFDGDTILSNLNGWDTITPSGADTWDAIELNVTDGNEGVGSYWWKIWSDSTVPFKLHIRMIVEVETHNSFTGYFCDFADVSDWTLVADGTTLTTDGDVASIKAGNSGGDDWDVAYTNTPDLSGSSVYFELQYKMNTTDIHYVYIYSYTGDYGVGDITLQKGLSLTTSWCTLKWLSTPTTIGSIHFTIRTSVAKAGPVDFQVNYLQIGPADEMGLQHDFSTTTGISSSDGGTISSDSDKVTLTADADGATFIIVADTTATAAKISTTYYPFLHLEITGGSSMWTLEQYDGSAYATLQSATTLTTGAKRFNMKTLDTYVEKWKITLSNSGTLISDFLQAYSIANYTVTQGNMEVDDVCYVSGESLVTTGDGGNEYFAFDHDPSLAVAQTTYSVLNLTIGGWTDPDDSNNQFWFQYYTGSWVGQGWDKTRDALPTGTTTDFRIYIYVSLTISAIKFIEDNTAPTVVRSSSTPNDPEDDETITLSAVITDPTEVYKVYFDAIVYPAGFSDIPYYATEQSDNFWYYEFSTLQNGYYCFKIQATDGANTNELTEYAYLTLNVREAAIIVEEITLIGAGEDFTMMTFSARINRDCTYTIYEESTTSAETDTYSGSVTSPSFNLAWEKLDVDDSNVNFTIKFVSGSLTYNYTSQYQVAQTTFYVEHYNHNGPDWSEYVTVTGRITKYASYTVYIDDVEATTGTITNLDFDIEFSKTLTSATREAWHDWAIKFTNGSQTCWANGTLYLWKNNPDQAEIGGGDLGRDERLTIQMWTTIGVIIGVMGVVSIGLVYFKFDEVNKLQLPNYPTQPPITREQRRREENERRKQMR